MGKLTKADPRSYNGVLRSISNTLDILVTGE